MPSNSQPDLNKGGQALTEVANKNAGRIRKKRKSFKMMLFSSPFVLVVGVVGLVTFSQKEPVEDTTSQASSSVLDPQTTSVDQIAAANVASSVAQTVDMSVQTSVESLAVSLNAKTELAQTASTFITKPQIIQQDSGQRGIIYYLTVTGDSVPTIAAKYGISEDSVRWSNGMVSDNIEADKILQLPGVTGIIYTVKDGDTADSLASKYKGDADLILSYNNLEISGLSTGLKIVIPDGILPENERPGYVAVSSSYSSSVSSTSTVSTSTTGSYSGNNYAYGYCTYYAYNRRAELGSPIGGNWGNAATWAIYAAAAGFSVDKNPRAGDVFQISGGLGHVGVVERVNDDGSIYVSEMNYVGWNIISYRTISASALSSYNFIH